MTGHYQIHPRTLPHVPTLLRVEGDSMRDAGILDGDLIAVRKASMARDILDEGVFARSLTRDDLSFLLTEA